MYSNWTNIDIDITCIKKREIGMAFSIVFKGLGRCV